MSSRRVVITGMGCISPLGNDVSTTWAGILAGKSGVGPITQFDAREFETRFAAEVKDFDAEALLGRKLARRMDRYTQFAIAATDQALRSSALEVTDSNRDRIGVIIGTGIGGIATLMSEAHRLAEHGPRRVSPFMVPMMLPDSGAGQVAIVFGLRGPNMAVVTACATGSNAIGEASEMIRRGDVDAMIAGGAEAAIVPIAMAGFDVMDAVSKRNDDPQGASRPFDLNRDGFVVGEGGACLVLEAEEHALRRGAPILAVLSGYAATNDAYHISAPAENGAGAARCMHLALEHAGLTTDAIQYINAHGTSTHLNDLSETAAIKTSFGERAYDLAISSTKSMTGHLLGAAGAIEAIFCVLALRDQVMPPTINYHTPDPACDLDYVPNATRKSHIDHVMSNSFGFGGHNACLVISRPGTDGHRS